MQIFLQKHKQVLIYCLALGVILFSLEIASCLFIKGAHPEVRSTIDTKIYLVYLASLLLIVSAEAVVKRDWKNAIIIILGVGTFSAFFRFLPIEVLDNEMSNLQLKSALSILLSNIFVFLLIRYRLMKVRFNVFTIFFASIVILALTVFIIRSFRITISEQVLNTSTFLNQVNVFTLLWPVTLWLLVYTLDLFVMNDDWRKEFLNINSGISRSIYKERSAILLVLQLILLALLYIHIVAKNTLNEFDVLLNMALVTVFLAVSALLFIQSQKRMVFANRSPAFIYLFAIPLLNIFPALYLCAAGSEAKMTSENEEPVYSDMLDLCKSCVNKYFDFKKGLVCNLTKEKPAFIDTCSDYRQLNFSSLPIVKNAPNSLLYTLRIFLFVFFVIFLVQAISKLNNTYNISATVIITIVVNFILQIGLIINLWNLKRWAVLALLGLLSINISLQLYLSRSSQALIFYIIFFAVSYLLITLATPLWSYMTGFEKKKVD